MHVEDQWLRDSEAYGGWRVGGEAPGGQKSRCSSPLLLDPLADPRFPGTFSPFPQGAEGTHISQTSESLAQPWGCGQGLHMGFPHWSRVLNLLCLCQSLSQRVSKFSLVTRHTRISQAFRVGQDLTSLGFGSRFGPGADLASWIRLRFRFRCQSQGRRVSYKILGHVFVHLMGCRVWSQNFTGLECSPLSSSAVTLSVLL